jgi:hypothetical protein
LFSPVDPKPVSPVAAERQRLNAAALRVEPQSFAEQLAAYFKARPNVWVDGFDLAMVAGGYAWRTRVSDIRKPPFNMTIQNRQVRIAGSKAVASQYRFVPHE